MSVKIQIINNYNKLVFLKLTIEQSTSSSENSGWTKTEKLESIIAGIICEIISVLDSFFDTNW